MTPKTLTVKLTYFKQTTGKYYTEETFETHRTEYYSIIQEVRRRAEKRALPGLVTGCGEYAILVQIPDHPLWEDTPHLVFTEEEG